MFLRRRARSRDLSGRAVVLKPVRSTRATLVRVVVALAVLGGVGAAGAWYLDNHFVPVGEFEQLSADLRGLEQDNQQLRERLRESGEASQELRDELQRAGLDLEIAAVTRMELERQIVVLNEQLKQVQEELEFIKTAGSDKR